MKKYLHTVCTILLAITILSLCILCAHLVYEHIQNKYFFQAVEAGDYDAVQTAINRGANINTHRYSIYIPDGVLMNPTPLMVACKNGNVEIVKLLLSNGADVNIPDSITGKTPLLAALQGTKGNRFSLAFYLIENGADIHVTIKNNSPIAECLYVSEKDSEETIEEGFSLFQYLVENGSPTDSIPFNESALTYAAHYRNYRAVDYLLQNQYFSVNDYDGNENTALIVAAKNNRLDIVSLLLEFGADPALMDGVGKTAYDYAVEKEYAEIAKLLVENK